MSRATTIQTATHPDRDTVLYDGQCGFCRNQVAWLRRFDPCGWLRFMSLHDDRVRNDFPELSREQLLEQMFVVDRRGRARGGADAVRYLSRRLPLLWPLAGVLHIPGSLPLWSGLYKIVARNRYRLAGRCDEGVCRIP